MASKLRTFTVVLTALVAASAFIALGASAKTGGHFISEAANGQTIVNQKSAPSSQHFFEFTVPGLTGIICDEITATGTAVGATVTEPAGTLTASKCKTTGGTSGETVIHGNGCQIKPTVTSGEPQTTEQTIDFTCPAGKAIEITHPNCTMKVPPQNNLGNLTYTSVIDNGKHAITADVALTGITLHFEGGACILLGTNKLASLSGSTIVRGFEDKEGVPGAQVGITAT